MGPTLNRDDVELITRDTLYKGFFRLEALELRHRLFEGGWSATMRREMHNRHDAVGVLLYDPERDALILVEQFRAGAIDDPHSPGSWNWWLASSTRTRPWKTWRAVRPRRKPVAKWAN